MKNLLLRKLIDNGWRFVGPIGLMVLALLRSPFDSYDWINRRWLQGWVAFRQPISEPSSGWEFFARPVLNDLLNAFLLDQGGWIITALVVGGLQGVIFTILILVGKIHLAATPTKFVVLAGLSCWSGPLVFEHLGLESGHALAAAAYISAIALVTADTEVRQPEIVGAFIGLGLLLKFSSVSLALVLLVIIAATTATFYALRCVSALAQTVMLYYGAVAFWRRTDLSGVVTVVNRSVPFWFLLFLTILLTFGSALLVKRGQTRPATYPWRTKPSWSLAFFGLISVFVLGTSMTQADVRFKPEGIKDSFTRALTWGSSSPLSRDFLASKDLEADYFDVSKGLALLIFLVAVRTAFDFRRESKRFAFALLAMIPFVVVLQVEISTGYVRYATEALMVIPVVLVILIGADKRGGSKRMFLGIVSLVALVPATGLFGRAGYSEIKLELQGPLVSREDQREIQQLIPINGVVFLQGERSWLIPPLVDRPDIRIEIEPRRPHQVGHAREANVFYDPVDFEKLDKYTTRGWTLDYCQALRHSNVDLGWCRLVTES